MRNFRLQSAAEQVAGRLREEQRKPQPGRFARVFLGELEVHGLPTGSYNLPDREDSAEGFLFNLAQQHLARRGILAPEHVSLVCADPDPASDWFHPTVAKRSPRPSSSKAGRSVQWETDDRWAIHRGVR